MPSYAYREEFFRVEPLFIYEAFWAVHCKNKQFWHWHIISLGAVQIIYVLSTSVCELFILNVERVLYAHVSSELISLMRSININN